MSRVSDEIDEAAPGEDGTCSTVPLDLMGVLMTYSTGPPDLIDEPPLPRSMAGAAQCCWSGLSDEIVIAGEPEDTV